VLSFLFLHFGHSAPTATQPQYVFLKTFARLKIVAELPRQKSIGKKPLNNKL
jgi:hypothetical protein